MVERKYSFGTSVMYQTLTIILLNCAKNFAKFAGFRGKYDATLIPKLQLELADAEKMKSDQARSLEHESLRVDMLPLAEVCREKWQYLKRYIAVSFEPLKHVQNWDAAGWENYSDSWHSWDKLAEMCRMANEFIIENEATLKDVGTMPDDFKDVFAECSAAFVEKYNAFLMAQENAMQGTNDKIEANNAIFEKVSEICADGQIIFMKDEVKKRLFSMEAVSELVKPVGAAGLKGIVTQDGKPQAGLLVELENGNKSVTTDVDGAFDFGNQLASGTDTIIVRRGDEILAEDEVVIPAGVTKREEVKLRSPSPLTPGGGSVEAVPTES